MEQKVTAYEFCSIHKSLSEVFVAYIGLKKKLLYVHWNDITSNEVEWIHFKFNMKFFVNPWFTIGIKSH